MAWVRGWLLSWVRGARTAAVRLLLHSGVAGGRSAATRISPARPFPRSRVFSMLLLRLPRGRIRRLSRLCVLLLL